MGALCFRSKPKDPVRPATPVRPVTPVGDIPQEHYFKAIEPFDTLPLTIPRIDIRKTDGSKASNSPHSFSSYNEQISPRSGVSFEQRSTRSPRSAPISPRHVTNTSGIPMKKVTRKSRWVSIHDGRPMSPFVETVTYEPKYPIMERNYDERTHLNPESIVKNKQVSYYDDDRYLQRPHYSNNGRYIDECAYIVENPLYRD